MREALCGFEPSFGQVDDDFPMAQFDVADHEQSFLGNLSIFYNKIAIF